MRIWSPKQLPWILLLFGFLNTIHEGEPLVSIVLLLSGALLLWITRKW